MRLLYFDTRGGLNLTEERFEDTPPEYAILSHTWGADEEEVTFEDLQRGNYKRKAGYAKLQFCGKQAQDDGLKYFWADTCCIDKSNAVELQEAITCMFRWYRDSAKCYVFLTDVTTRENDHKRTWMLAFGKGGLPSQRQSLASLDSQSELKWELAFRKSRWFTRGWTLQELIAPKTVEFFSREGENLGNRNTLEEKIHEITGIPIDALRGTPLSSFSVEERMRWAENRTTRRKEDKAYCLLGIFRVFMPLLYGEGDNAFDRLKKEIEVEVKSQNDCLKSLSFLTIDDRQNTIAEAHEDTCDWLFTTPQFTEWRSRSNLSDHNGVLWIKGKPGSGKSTLMKHTLDYCRTKILFDVVATFFFNARGSELEQNSLGMLRSLLFQLLDQRPDIFDRFLPLFRDKKKKHEGRWVWHTGELKNFLLSEMRLKHPKNILILIDALDECTENEVRDIVSFIERMSIVACQNGNSLSICLSSRHYPTVSMHKSLNLELEVQSGHDRDIDLYIEANLRTTHENIKTDLYNKADHVFLWVVLVVKMLNIAYDEGREWAMRKKLNEIPSDLEQVFQILLEKDNQHKEETLLLLQWTLFVQEPLHPEAAYFAVLAGTSQEDLESWASSKKREVIRRYLTSTSRGLVEVQGYDPGYVQFIHLSVKEFLLRNKRLARMDPSLETNTVAKCHDQLAAFCASQIRLSGSSASGTTLRNHPFLEYALRNLLKHAEIAQANGINQEVLLGWLLQPKVGLDQLTRTRDTFHNVSHGSRSDGTLLLPYLAAKGFPALVACCSRMNVDIDIEDKTYGTALEAASRSGDLELVKLLVDLGADLNAGRRIPLAEALGCGYVDVMKLLIERGADLSARDGKAVIEASVYRQLDALKLLIERGADVNARDGEAVIEASGYGHLDALKLLIEGGADVNARNGMALIEASTFGHVDALKLLIEGGADVNARNGMALIEASTFGHVDALKLLIERGADVGITDRTALLHALDAGDMDAARRLLGERATMRYAQHKALMRGWS